MWRRYTMDAITAAVIVALLAFGSFFINAELHDTCGPDVGARLQHCGAGD